MTLGTRLGRWSIAFYAAQLLVFAAASAQVPQLVPYQGKLLDATGAPAADGTYAMEFRFYDDCVAGTLLLTDVHPAVQTINGIYSVLLGNGTLLSGTENDLLGVFRDHSTVCLGVKVESDSEMVPRQQIGSVAYAIRSLASDTSVIGVDESDDVVWTGTHDFQQSIGMQNDHSIRWPHSTGNPPPTANFRVTKFTGFPAGQENHPNSELDEQWMVCYNCEEYDTAREDLSQHAWNQKIEANYFEGSNELLEYNWNYTSPGGLKWRPFAFHVNVDGQCSHDASYCTDDADCGAGNTCDGANLSEFSFRSDPNETAVRLTEAGRFTVFKGFDGFIDYTGKDVTANPSAFFVNHLLDFNSAPPTLVALGMLLESNYAPTAPGTQIADMFGLRSKLIFSGSADDRGIQNKMVAIDAWNALTQTGGGSPLVNEVFGIRYKFEPTGNNVAITESAGIRIDIPNNVAAVDPITIDEHFGIEVRDQRGFGATRGAAIIVEQQTRNLHPDRGNLVLEGGGFDDGHLVLEQCHMWMDKTNNVLRFKNGAPATRTDGAPIHSPDGTNTNWGGMYWGDSGSIAHDSGDEVCALAHLSCLETYDMGGSTAIGCSVDTHGTARFLVLCH